MRFEDFNVFRRAARLAAEFYPKLGSHKNISFRDQITRSGSSILSIRAEGFVRDSKKNVINSYSMPEDTAEN